MTTPEHPLYAQIKARADFEGSTIDVIWFDAHVCFIFPAQTIPPDWMRAPWVALLHQHIPGAKRDKRLMIAPFETPYDIRSISRVVYNAGNFALLRHPTGPMFMIVGDRWEPEPPDHAHRWSSA